MKHTLVVLIILLTSVVFAQTPEPKNQPSHAAGVEKPVKASIFHGFLFTKLAAIGTKTEGLVYFLQLYNYKELAINKHVALFQNDKILDPFVGKKVQIIGDTTNRRLIWTSIKKDTP
jgi:hypothetical protein